MGRGLTKEGIEARQRVLEELARRWEKMEPQPTVSTLAEALGIERNTLYGYIKDLRRKGQVNETAILITPAGYARVRHTQ